MRTRYPARSRRSDLAARVVSLRLRAVAADERDFMVTVVTSRNGRAFVGFSGTHREVAARLDAELAKLSETVGDAIVARAHLSPEAAFWARKARLTVARWSREYEWLGNYLVLADRKYHHLGAAGQQILFRGELSARQMDSGSPLTAADQAELAQERAIRRAGLDAGETAKAAARRLVSTAPRSATFKTEQTKAQAQISASVQSMAEEQHRKAEERRVAGQAPKDPGPIHGFNWNCAEPKALFDAVVHGDGIQGMTTFWYGNAAAEAVVKYRVEDTTRDRGARDLVLCRPCDRCSEFEAFIMAAVSRLEDKVRRSGMPALNRLRRVALPLEAPW